MNLLSAREDERRRWWSGAGFGYRAVGFEDKAREMFRKVVEECKQRNDRLNEELYTKYANGWDGKSDSN